MKHFPYEQLKQMEENDFDTDLDDEPTGIEQISSKVENLCLLYHTMINVRRILLELIQTNSIGSLENVRQCFSIT